jgi:hypothetical protein
VEYYTVVKRTRDLPGYSVAISKIVLKLKKTTRWRTTVYSLLSFGNVENIPTKIHIHR